MKCESALTDRLLLNGCGVEREQRMKTAEVDDGYRFYKCRKWDPPPHAPIVIFFWPLWFFTWARNRLDHTRPSGVPARTFIRSPAPPFAQSHSFSFKFLRTFCARPSALSQYERTRSPMRGPEQEITKVFVVSSSSREESQGSRNQHTMRTTTMGCRRRSSRSDGRAAIFGIGETNGRPRKTKAGRWEGLERIKGFDCPCYDVGPSSRYETSIH
jgi:hypothetical protein